MRDDLTKFLLLCAVFVVGFGASISALLFEDQHSSISSLAGALHATLQGLLGTQDMELVTTTWEAEAVYSLYLVVAQVLLMNLLIAMFASTYERIKEHEKDEWRLARAQIILEYSHEVRGVLELPVLNLLRVVLVPLGWLWHGLRQCGWCLGPARVTSRVRLPWEEVLDGDDSQEGEQTETTRRRSPCKSQPQEDFSEATLCRRWLDEREDADPADFGELQGSLAKTLDSELDKVREQQTSLEAKVASLEKTMVKQQASLVRQQASLMEQQASLEERIMEQQVALKESVERQAEESNKRLDRLVTLVSVMHGHQQEMLST
jgi:hypothetical protein